MLVTWLLREAVTGSRKGRATRRLQEETQVAIPEGIQAAIQAAIQEGTQEGTQEETQEGIPPQTHQLKEQEDNKEGWMRE